MKIPYRIKFDVFVVSDLGHTRTRGSRGMNVSRGGKEKMGSGFKARRGRDKRGEEEIDRKRGETPDG